MPGMASVRVGNQGGMFGVEASGPYRLIPYGRNSTFTGRKNLLESVERFSEPTAHSRIALHGLGGSGKTQIALEYVYRHASQSGCHVFWVGGSGLLSFSEGFRDVAQLVRIPRASTEGDEEGYLKSIRKWFEGPNSGDWILVIDNADNDADFVGNNGPIAKFVPQGTKGIVIFTTRSLLVASRQGCKIIEVGEMEEDDALELFSKRFTGGDSLGDEGRTAITMILASLHHLPLAIVGAAAFMTETKTSPPAYWTILRESDERAKRLLSQQFCDIQRELDVTESILGTYFATFDRITQQMPPAADLLRLMAFLDRQNIPEELLNRSGLKGVDDPVEFRQAIGRLLAFSLVAIVTHEEKTFYELHRLVQLSLQVYLPTKKSTQARAAALKVVSQLFPRDESKRRYVGPIYIPHALAVTQDSRGPIAEDLCFHMGLYFLDKGSYNNAEIQFRRCIALRGKGGRKILGPDHPDTLMSANSLAVVLRNRGKHDESEAMHRHTMERRKKILGPDHPDTLMSANNLAIVLQDQGKHDEAEAMHRFTLERRVKILGPDHSDTLGSTNNLAIVLQAQGRHDESQAMYQLTLEGQEKILGPDHPDTLMSANNLAIALQNQGKHDEAAVMYRRTLERRKKILGPDHPKTLSSANN
ncbi:unnamed protein product, partial [Tuber aestivum]